MSLRKKSINSFFWTFGEQIGTGIIAIIISTILGRILEPEEFGLIGMILVFVAIGNSLVDSGMGTSLIRSKTVSDIDFSTVFFFNIIISVSIYLLLFFIAPYIAIFFEAPILKNLTRVYCLTIIIRSLSVVQIAIFIKDFNFKALTIIQMVSLAIGGGLGIYLALSEFGVWSLVFYPLVQFSISTVLYWLSSKWKPKLNFNKQTFNKHFSFGYKVTTAGLIDTIFKNIYNVLIGKFFSAELLGYYNRADTLHSYPPNILSIALRKFTLPLFSEIQDENERLKSIYKKIMRLAIFFLAPIMICGILVAEPLFVLLLTEKWLPAVPFFQILCFSGMLLPLQTYNLNILHVKGRSDILLKTSIYKKIIFVTGALVAFQFGIYPLIIWSTISSLFSFFINASYCGRMISYSLFEQIKDALSVYLPAILLGSIFFLFKKNLIMSSSQLLQIITITSLYLLVYVVLHLSLKSKELSLANELIRNRKK